MASSAMRTLPALCAAFKSVSQTAIVEMVRSRTSMKSFIQMANTVKSWKLNEEISSKIVDIIQDDEAVVEATTWLGKYTEPWEVVIAKWKLTSDFRRRDNDLQKDSKFYGGFERWPILKHPKGYDLIEEDNASLKLTITEPSARSWCAFYSKLQNIGPLRKDYVNAESLNRLLIESNELTEDSRVVLQLLTLPHIIPPKGRLRNKKSQWKPSISECKDGIIMHAMLPGYTTIIQEKRNEAMNNLGLSLQPFIVAIGPALAEVSSFYVCVNKVLYKVPSYVSRMFQVFPCVPFRIPVFHTYYLHLLSSIT